MYSSRNDYEMESPRYHKESGTGFSTSSRARITTQNNYQSAVQTVEVVRTRRDYDDYEMEEGEYVEEQTYVEEGEYVEEETYIEEGEIVEEKVELDPISPTPSYYETGCDDTSKYKYLLASDVRRQVREAPYQHRSQGRYPTQYRNLPAQPLKSRDPWTEYPIVESPRKGESGRNYRRGKNPGPVRAFYNNDDREVFDVGYHDHTQPPYGPREGRQYSRVPFSLAKYHPASNSAKQECAGDS